MYFRDTVEGVDIGDSSNGTSTPIEAATVPSDVEKNEKTTSPTTLEGAGTAFAAEKTFRQKLQLFVKMPGRPSLKQLWTMMYRPLLIMYHFPCVTWAGL